ncbi:MAG: hypothetical protein JF612_00010 [Planctomycetia bacterium]|nr:hypothetical protein [Planctomycetia bacterium]
MTKTASQRLKLGDIVELRSSKGYFYAQFINVHVRPRYRSDRTAGISGAQTL